MFVDDKKSTRLKKSEQPVDFPRIYTPPIVDDALELHASLYDRNIIGQINKAKVAKALTSLSAYKNIDCWDLSYHPGLDLELRFYKEFGSNKAISIDLRIPSQHIERMSDGKLKLKLGNSLPHLIGSGTKQQLMNIVLSNESTTKKFKLLQADSKAQNNSQIATIDMLDIFSLKHPDLLKKDIELLNNPRQIKTSNVFIYADKSNTSIYVGIKLAQAIAIFDSTNLMFQSLFGESRPITLFVFSEQLPISISQEVPQNTLIANFLRQQCSPTAIDNARETPKPPWLKQLTDSGVKIGPSTIFADNYFDGHQLLKNLQRPRSFIA